MLESRPPSCGFLIAPLLTASASSTRLARCSVSISTTSRGGLFFFPLFAILTIFFAIRAVLKPRVAGKVMGWIAIALLVLSIPLVWNGYAVWILAGTR